MHSIHAGELHLPPHQPTPVLNKYETVARLMTVNDHFWTKRGGGVLINKINKCIQLSPAATRPANAVGFFEKRDLPTGTQVAVVGDLHGNGLRLKVTLQALQKRGFLDEEYRCLQERRIIFLGDYVDRGSQSLRVLETVVTLKLENPDQVDLLRGNHEDIAYTEQVIDSYADTDGRYFQFWSHQPNRTCLANLYDSMPATLYVSELSESGKRRYMQFSHGLFHMYTDPLPLLESQHAHAVMWLNHTNDFSERLRSVFEQIEGSDGESAQKRSCVRSVQRVQDAARRVSAFEIAIDRLNARPLHWEDIFWLDVQDTLYPDQTTDRLAFPPALIEAWLNLVSSENAKIVQIVRGHQGACFVHLDSQERLLVATIDPSKDPENQCFVELTLSGKLRAWPKNVVRLPLYESQRAIDELTVEPYFG